jgi:hypothetical protein
VGSGETELGGEGEVLGASPPPRSTTTAVLTHRRLPHGSTETRWWGTSTSSYACGDFSFINVVWKQRAHSVPRGTDLRTSPAQLEAAAIAPDDGSGGDPLILNPAAACTQNGTLCSSFLIRERYLMWGDLGNAVDSPDNCIRLDVTPGYKSVGG